MHDKMVMMISPAKKKLRKQILKYALSIRKFFRYNPFDCPNCGTTMVKICYIIRGG